MTIGTQRLRLLRGNTAASSAFTGLGGELIVDTTLNTIRVQDGYTPGGTLLATTSDLANVSIDQLTNGIYSLVLDTNGDAIIPGNLVSANATLTSYIDLHKDGLGGIEAGAYTDFTILTDLGGSINEWYFGTNGNLTIPGNINYANGVSILSGITANGGGNYSNANVASYLPTYSGNVNAAYFTGNGALLTGIAASSNYGNTNVAAYLPVYGGTVNSNRIINTSDVNLISESFVQVQYDPSGNYDPYTLGDGSWFYLGSPGVGGGLVFESNLTGNTHAVRFNDLGNVSADGSITFDGNLINGASNWNFAANGVLTFPGSTMTMGHSMGDYIYTSDNFFVNSLTTTLSAAPDGGNLSQINMDGYGNVSIRTIINNGNDSSWNFRLGSLTLPGGAQFVTYDDTGAVDLAANVATDSYIGLTYAYRNWMWVNDTAAYIETSDGYTGRTWTFGTDGNLTLPGNINFTRGQQVYTSGNGTNNNFITVTANIRNDINGFQVGESSAGASLYTSGGIKFYSNTAASEFEWDLNADGTTTFPDQLITAPFITGNTATYDTLYGQLGTAAQPSITSLGTLTGVAVSGTISTSGLQVNGNATIGNLLVTGTSTIIGNINMISGNSGQFFGNSPTGFNALYTGIAAGYTPLQQTIIQSSGNYNDYVQNNLENVNSGNAATGDYVVTADNGTDASYYVDMGIASSNFDGLSPNIVGNSVRANDAYLYTLGNGAGNQGGNLIIGAGTASKVVKFIAGGGHDHDVVATVAAGAFTVTGNITGTYIFGNGSQLTGLPATYTNSNVASYLPTYTGNLSAANISLTNNTSAITFNTGAYIYGDTVSRPGSIFLQPNTSVAGFPSVVIGGAGRLAAPNGSVHVIFNTNDLTVQVPLKAISAAAATSTSTGALIVSGGAGIAGNVVAGGNISGNFFIGNGALLTGITASSNYNNTNVTAFLGDYGSNTIVTTGNISAGYFVGNGALLTGIIASGSNYGNTNVASFLGAYGSNTIVTTGNITVGNLSATTNISVTSNLIVGSGAGGFLFRPLVGGTGATIYSLNAAPSQTNYALSYNGASLNLNAPTGGGIYSSIQNSIVTTLTSTGLAVTGALSATGNITGNFFVGNGALLTGIVANTTYSNTNVASYLTGNIVVGNISGSQPGVTLVANIYSYEFSNVGNVSFPGNLSVTSNVSGNYFIGNGALLTGIVAGSSNYGNSNVATFLGDYGSNTIVTTGNVSAGYFVGNGALLTGIVASGSSYGNANVANYLASNSAVPIVTTSNVTAGYFIGNGALLTGIAASSNYGDSNVTSLLSSYGSNTVVTTGNISAGYFIGDGSLLTGITATANYNNSNVALFLSNIGSNAISTTGNISAGYFIGDGSLLTGITATANYNNSNVVTFLASFGSNTISTTGNITAGNIIANQFGNSTGTTATYTGNVTVGNLSISGNIVDTGALSIISGNNGNISLIPNGTGIVTAPGSLTAFGNVVTAYATQANASTLFIGNNTTISAGGASASSTYVMNNAYYNTAGVLTARNTLAAGAGQFEIAGGTFNWNAVSSATANTAAGMGVRMSLSSSGLATQNSIGITSAGTLTVQGSGGLVTTQTTFPLLTTVATAINFGNVANVIAIGSNVSSVTFGNGTGNISAGNITASGNITAGNISTTGVVTLSGGNVSGVGNLVGVSSNTTITANTFVTSFLSNGAITTTSNVIVTGSNAISIPNLPAFRVYGNTSTNFTAGTTLTNQLVDYNQGNYYNNSTGFFTAPVAGLYHCYATVRVANNNSLNQAGIQKNSSQSGANVIAFWETDTNTGTAMHFSMTGYAKCVVGDTIRLQVISGNVNFDTNDSWGVTFIG